MAAGKKINFNTIFTSIFLTFSLIISLIYFNRTEIYQLFTEASGQPADLTVNLNQDLGELNPIWQNLAQGGEDLSGNMLLPVAAPLARLQPQTIRLDHIYDGYDVINRDGTGQLIFNWQRLDAVVASIRQSGATPMLALSYMPPAISSGDIIDPPREWGEWALVVQRTIEHYSGTLAIPNMIYEVWNEPDLFGNWRTYGSKNYLQLYHWAAIGASRARVKQSFKLGGPATTAAYPAWMDRFLDYVAENDLRMDFISWHRYSKNIDDYRDDIALVKWSLAKHSQYFFTTDLYITESGPNGELDDWYDSLSGAAHILAITRAVIDDVNRLYTFEVVDGHNVFGQTYWGRWGLLTHPSVGIHTKPRYQALQFLNRLSGTRITVNGEGTWVTALATRTEEEGVQVLVINYDRFARHNETAPLTIIGITPGEYLVSRTLFGGGVLEVPVAIDATGIYKTNVSLPPQRAVLVEISKQE